MPCRSDYMEPTGKERQLQDTAKLLKYALFELDLPVPSKVRTAADDVYCQLDLVPDLCKLITNMNELQVNRVVYNAQNKQARKLADWWEEHQRADRKRIASEMKKIEKEALIESAMAKLTDSERAALGLKGKRTDFK